MRKSGILLLTFGSLSVALAYGVTLVGVAEHAAPWWLAVGITAVLAGLATLGAARRGRRTPILLVTIVITFVSVGVGFLVPLALAAPDASTPLLLGLPRPTAILMLFVHAVPLLLMPLAYAAAFEREVLGADDIARIRELR